MEWECSSVPVEPAKVLFFSLIHFYSHRLWWVTITQWGRQRPERNKNDYPVEMLLFNEQGLARMQSGLKARL